MADILKKSVSPITAEAWSLLEAEAKRSLSSSLSARKCVDFHGPLGWTSSSVNLGRLKLLDKDLVKGLKAGIRLVQPLVELRVPFTLDLWDLDDVSRGALDPNVEELRSAAKKAALFEESAIYLGYKEAGIQGMLEASPVKPISVEKTDCDSLFTSLENAIISLQKAGTGGPYALVLGSSLWELLMLSKQSGFPVRKRIDGMFSSGLHWSPALSGGAVISTRGGDYELTVGQDFSLGYKNHDGKNVELFLAESFTFRVLEPGAAVELKLTAK